MLTIELKLRSLFLLACGNCLYVHIVKHYMGPHAHGIIFIKVCCCVDFRCNTVASNNYSVLKPCVLRYEKYTHKGIFVVFWNE